jgi:hypothetical protein
MAKLTRIYTSGIGAKVARFSPLLVDFRNGKQQPDDAIVWLRNGGGKTCWLALVYSIFRPRSAHFLLRKAKGRDSSITDFIQGNDLAYVITEWDSQGSLLPDKKSLRVVGQVLAWKGGQKSDDRGKLKHIFFSFRCSEKLHLDLLPVMGISANPAKTLDDFTDWLTETQSRYPNLEVTLETNFDSWDEHLGKIGLDSALFQFQILMNQREGDIDQYFKDYCSSPQKFTREFLKMAFEPSKADSVSDNIIALRSKLKRRDPLEKEQAFIAKFLAELDPFLKEVEAFQLSQKSMDQARLQARGVQHALAASIAALAKEQETEKTLAAVAFEQAQVASQAAETLRKNINFIRVCHARLEVDGANKRVAAAQLAVEQAETHFKECRAAGKLFDLNDLKNRERAMRATLAEQLKKEQPVLEELQRRGSIFRELLRLGMVELDQKLYRLKQSKTNLENTFQTLTAELLGLTKKIGNSESQLQIYQSRVGQRDANFRSLLNNAVLEAGETAVAARERWESSITLVREEISRLESEIASKEIEIDQLTELIRTQGIELAGHEAKCRSLEALIAEAGRRKTKLESDRYILDLTGGKLPDLEFPKIMEGLKVRVSHLQQLIVQAEVDSAEDHRALKHLEQAGLLPPSLDVERALEQLKTAGISAFSALDFLSQNVHDPEESLRLLLSDPGKFSGIIINHPEQLEAVHTLLSARSLLKGPVQVSTPSLEPWPGEPDRVILPPASSGTLNHTAAQNEREYIQGRLTKHKTTQDARNLEIQEVDATIRQLSDYLENYATPKLTQVRLDLESTRGLAGIARIAIQSNKDRIVINRQNVRTLVQDIKGQEQLIEDYREKGRQLGSFIRDHDKDYEANRQRVSELGEELNGLRVQSTQLNADLEENRLSQGNLTGQETQHRVDRQLAEQDHSKVQYYNDVRPEVQGHDLSGSSADYTAQLAVFNKVSNSEIQAKCNILKEEISKKERDYSASSKGLHAIKVEALSRRTSLPSDTQAAEDDAKSKGQQQAVIKADLKRLQGELSKVEQECRNKTDKPESDAEPSNPEEAKSQQARYEAQLRTSMSESTEATLRANRHQNRQEECSRSQSRRDSSKDLVDALEPGDGEGAEVILPAEDNQLKPYVQEICGAYRQAEKNLSQTRKCLDGRFETIQEMLKKPDELGSENAMKTKLGALTKEALVHGAGEIRESADSRRTIIQKDLEAIELDRQGLIVEIEIIYSQARSLLNSAERISKLPDTMKAWANQPFLRIKLRELALSDVRLRLQDMLDAILKENESPTGLELAYLCVERVSGQDGIDVTILKPDVILQADRIPVESIMHFSGGEGVTTAILLYCTLLQLRSQTYGRLSPTRDAGTLILDNPIGKCSRPDLLKMHREISKQMHVQLLYLTGVNDVNAIGTFDRIIRLKNQHRNMRSGELHVTTTASSEMEKAEIQMAPGHA